jgi:hypothetical protein
LNIQKVLNTNSSLYEHSMGQMPNFVWFNIKIIYL